MLLVFLLPLLLLAGGPGGEKTPTSKAWPVPPAVPLAASELKATSTKWFWWVGTPQCDGEGNIYWHSGSLNVQALTFVKLLTDGSSVIYQPSGSQLADFDFISYYVRGDGQLFVLVTEKANYETLYLLTAANDPGSFSSTRLDVPDGLDPMTVHGFAVLASGEIFVHGYFGKEAPKTDRGRTYFLEFDASGKLLRRSSGREADSVVAKDLEKGIVPTQVAPAVGGDGLLYVLEPGRIVVLSRSGEIARTISLSPPNDGYDTPLELRAAGNRLLLTWRKSGERRLETEYELLDRSMGEVLRLYRPTENRNVLVCFTGNRLIFDGGKDRAGNVQLVSAPAD